jgi:hypothetical protein
MVFRCFLFMMLALAACACFDCAKKKPISHSKKALRLLESGVDGTYRNEKKENLLHCAIRSCDEQRIRLVNTRFPLLRTQADTNGYYPIHTAAANCPLNVIKLLDSLGFNFSQSVHETHSYSGCHATPDVLTIARERLNTEIHLRFDDSTRVTDADAEGVYAWIVTKVGESAWPDGENPDGLLQNAKDLVRRGFPVAAQATMNYLRRYPVGLKELLRYRAGVMPSLPLDSIDVSLLCKLPLPADHNRGEYFFTALKLNQPALTQAFIDQGAVVNNLSAHNKKVRSALTFAESQDMEANAAILKKNGATDAYWFEVLVPGFWPTIGFNYDTSLLWYAVISGKDSTFLRSGRLSPEYMRVQRKDYWTSAGECALFMIATNKPGGIAACESIISRPRLVTPDNPMQCKLRSGIVYELTAPEIKGSVLRVKGKGRYQDLLQYFPEPALNAKQEYQYDDSNAIWVVWAGDIDGDHELDILLTGASVDYANFDNTFFLALSSLATEGLLFGWADETYMYGSYQEFANNSYGREYGKESFFPDIKRKNE